MIIRNAYMALLLIGLVGCSPIQQQSALNKQSGGEIQDINRPIGVQPQIIGIPSQEDQTLSSPIIRPDPIGVPIQISALFGIDGAKLTRLFGAPSFIRRDGAVEIWYVRQSACMGLFYLYAKQDDRDQGGEVQWVDMVKLPEFKPQSQSCLVAYDVNG